MGNTAVKCCVGVAVVRVMRPNGRIDDFNFPVTAFEVMQRYPQHLVIHSNYLERDCSLEQQRKKVTIVRPESELLPDHEYILYPIPPQFKDVVAQTFAKQILPLNPEEEPHPKQQQKRKVGRRSQIIAATRQHLATIMQTSGDASKVADGGCEQIGGGGGGKVRRHEECLGSSSIGMFDIAGQVKEAAADDDEFCFYYSASWKPSLHSIPESPKFADSAHVERHSFSVSPLEGF